MKLSEAFRKADDVLTTAAKGIAEIITVPGYVNVDFEDVTTVMKNSGRAIMGSGVAEGEGRAEKAIKAAIHSPLLTDSNIEGAKNILLYITSGAEEVSLDEVDDILEIAQTACGNKSDVKFDGYKVTQNVSYSQYKSWLDAVKTGEKSIDGDDIIEAGGTMTLNAVKDAIRGMRDHFAANYKTVLEGMYGESYVSESVDTFTTLEGTTSHCSYKITKRYSVALTTGSGKAYEATVSFQDPEDETDTTKFIAAFSGDTSNVKLVGYKITQKINFEGYTSWIDKLTSGEKTLDDTDYFGTGATMSLNAVRDTLLAMRADYIASLGE
mgnify:CR=1 FL=1